MKLKFNLNFGGEQVRTIEDVRTQAINAREILSEIIKTFQENEETDPAYVEVDFSMFNYFDGGNKFRADFHPEQLSAKLDEALQQGSSIVIHGYSNGYNALIQDIIAHSDDLTYIYDRFDEITSFCSNNEIELNSMNLFERFYKEAPLAAFALLGHSKMRMFFQNNTQVFDKLSIFMSNRFGYISSYGYETAIEQLQRFDNRHNIKVSRDMPYTPNWCNEKISGKKYLVIYGQSDGTNPYALISGSGSEYRKHAIKVSQISSQLPIFDGIDYKCLGPHDRFYYMEAR